MGVLVWVCGCVGVWVTCGGRRWQVVAGGLVDLLAGWLTGWLVG